MSYKSLNKIELYKNKMDGEAGGNTILKKTLRYIIQTLF